MARRSHCAFPDKENAPARNGVVMPMKSVLLLAAVFAPAVCLAEEFIVVDTPKYSFEVPKGWTVGRETPWGARDIEPTKGDGKLGAMTAGPTKATWDSLYETSLYFIRRESKGKPTPYRIGKTKKDYECIRFEYLDESGFASKRYVLLKDADGNALALSVMIPDKKAEKKFVGFFDRMVDSAKIKS